MVSFVLCYKPFILRLDLLWFVTVDQLAGSLSELIAEQQSDVSLAELLGKVVPAAEVNNTAQGYCLVNSLLVWKWLSHQDTAVGVPVLQLIVPTTFWQKVL